MRLENENGKRQRWAVSFSFVPVSAVVLTIITPLYIQFENSLRRHNHLGLLHALLLGLAKAGKLDAAKEGANFLSCI
jgi:Ubiquitin carboxyl-terminal hydrolases